MGEAEAEAKKEGEEEGCREGKHRERGFQASSERSCSEYAGILSSLLSPTSSSGRATHTPTSSIHMASQIGHTGSDQRPYAWSFILFHVSTLSTLLYIDFLKFDLLLYLILLQKLEHSNSIVQRKN